VPEGWTPNTQAFLDGLQFGIYVVLAAMVVLIVISAVRRVLSL
jgi:hypothetical protein